MDMAHIFGVFSRRTKTKPKPSKSLTPEFRNRVVMALRDSLGGRWPTFWEEIHKKLAYLHGRTRLSPGNQPDALADVLTFIMTCPDGQFFDFVELALAAATVGTPDDLVKVINHFLLIDDLPYSLTGYVWTEMMDFFPGMGPHKQLVNRLTAYPQVIVRGSQVTHAMAIEPALTLLKHPDFVAANTEFLEALADYRKADYGDCLTKCGSAFESVLKVICARNKWPYDQKDTASTLLTTVFNQRPTLEPFLRDPLMIVATLRNRLSKAHGAGTTPKTVHPNRAEYMINATAAAILLIVSECA